MAEFARLGYVDGDGVFVPTEARARDVVASNGITAETHITAQSIHLDAEQEQRIANALQESQRDAVGGFAGIGADGRISLDVYEQVVLTDVTQMTDNIAGMLALSVTVAPVGTIVLVWDASADPVVASGWAMYKRISTGSNLDAWHIFVKGEALDINFEDFLQMNDIGTLVPRLDQDGANAGRVPMSQLPAGLALRDAAFIENIADITTANLRAGAVVLLSVDND